MYHNIIYTHLKVLRIHIGLIDKLIINNNKNNTVIFHNFCEIN